MLYAAMTKPILETATFLLFALPVLAPLLPARVTNRHPTLAGTLTRGFCVLAILSGALLLTDANAPRQLPFTSLSVQPDSFAALMLLLTGFLGVVISRYSQTHLREDPKAGDFQKWIIVATGGVAIMVLAADLITIGLGLLLSGSAMQPLLAHYQDRPAAREAARTKFVFNRIADASLLGAALIAYRSFATIDLKLLTERIGEDTTGAATVIAGLIAFAAVIRSVQLPFHSWLIGTVEAPVPVSALMHAGIVNGGGILLIRSAGVIAPEAGIMSALTLIGAATAITAALITATQPSIKQQLAFSTVAQMGFMVMECGIGAYTAATLHIAAHSLYKAHAFLNSGDVLREPPGIRPADGSPFRLVIGGVLLAAALPAICIALGQPISGHTNHLLLGFVFGLATIRGLQQGGRMLPATLGTLGLVLIIYLGSHVWLNQLLPPQATHHHPSILLCSVVALMFYLLFVAESLPIGSRYPDLSNALRVHAANGFYLDLLWKRTFRALNT